ncbi:PREDICTED: xaa-Pro aminopeptidase 1-like [Polistes canadensis]|uniref:xaa-Pro aminopeptidase 1-like n=1 Tax=Polistes canadensis TaxID=91411 RepID=UPI000718DF9C|nr:PREDICTED: xaa-Pro aminopeptidase 1-like [Polistes canadensis]XP_014608135.1 PREDICTED: xaa-Pro aminopeptidase 1-like [Polistes canadensis]
MAQSGHVKLTKLRELMKAVQINANKTVEIQAYVVTSEDAHQSEYLRKYDQRLTFISGFTGSLGTAVITQNKALLWTDGRYFTQALSQFDPPEEWTLMKDGLLETPSIQSWLVSNLPPKSVIGADPNLLSYNKWITLQTTLVAGGHTLFPIEENLIDKVWGKEKPLPAANKIIPQKLEFSGESAGEKVKLYRKIMESIGVKMLIITALDEVAYLLNLRGSDIPYNPVFFAFVVLTKDELHFFVDVRSLTEEAIQQMTNEGIKPNYHPYSDIHDFIKCEASFNKNKLVWISNGSSYAIHSDCGELKKHIAISPVCVAKAIKNSIEIEGMKAAHRRDAVALVKYFAWLEDKIKNKKELVTEISGAEQLEKFRSEQEHYVGLSFSTISSVGPHGAIIHYTPSPETDVPITDKELYLCDSGAQYKDGTTDVTRTLHFGEPTNYQRECFTRVFKGQCRLSSTIFPFKTKGNYLDTLARESLWSVGLNYLHGTGHGIGSYLNVHEQPIGISWKPYPDDPGLHPGMFLSNEPGYYKNDEFGIRLENIELIVKAETKYKFDDNGFLTFETVTLVPIQTSLLDVSLLTDEEIKYLNDYHAKCFKTLCPFLDGPENAQAREWLERETQPINK